MTVITRRLLAVVTAVAVASVGAACSKVPGVYVYEKDGETAAAASVTDPKTYVDNNWTQKIVPTVHDNAVDVTTVAAAIADDPGAAGKKYGNQTGTGSPYAFMVKGSGTVTEVDTSVPTGPVTVEVPGPGGGKPVKVTIATGPVIAGTAVRDAVKFIAFGDFTNQIAYADVANKLNDRAKTDVIAKVDLKSVTGKRVTFAGAFSALAPGTIFLVPTELQVG